MNKKLLLFALVSLILIGTISSAQTSLGTYKQGECLDLIQLCADCSYNNITSVIYPNTTRLIYDMPMTQRGSEFNYSFCNTNLTGEYIVNGIGDLGGVNTVWAYTFDITTTGEAIDVGRGIINGSSLLVLTILFIISLVGLFKVQSYISKFALFWVTYLLFIALTFTTWNISSVYMIGTSFVIGFFRVLFLTLLIAMFPLVLLSLAWVFYIHTATDEIRSMMERGMTSEEAWDRSARNTGKGWFGI